MKAVLRRLEFLLPQARQAHASPSALLGWPRTLDALCLDEALLHWGEAQRMLYEAHATKHRKIKRQGKR